MVRLGLASLHSHTLTLNSIKERYVNGELAARWVNGEQTAVGGGAGEPGRIEAEGRRENKKKRNKTKKKKRRKSEF